MNTLEEGSIEIILKKVTLAGFQNKKTELLLTFIAGKSSTGSTVLWTVQNGGSTARPIEFFYSYDQAIADLHCKVGAAVLGGMAVHKYDTYGEIKGNYHSSAVRKDGFVVRNSSIEEPKAPTKKEIKTPPPPPEQKKPEATLILEDVDE